MSHSQYPFHTESLGSMQRVKITVCLVATFFVSFLAATILTDYLDWKIGYYSEGIADSESLDRGEF